MKLLYMPVIYLLLLLLIYLEPYAQKNPADYVNTFIGTGGHGHTYPGATLPFGMVQLSPDTRLEGWDGCSGYHYDDEYIYGFSHTHLNGTGVADLCDVLFMPTVGENRWKNGVDGQSGYRSHFSHKNEQSEPGYYKVLLDEGNIIAELTATTRVGFHRYTFPDYKHANLLLDLFHRDEVLESSIHIKSTTEIEGFRRSSSWAEDQSIYFVAQFSKPFSSYEIAVNDIVIQKVKAIDKKKNLKAYFRFDSDVNEAILLKVGISAVSYEGARNNLKQELPGWDFDSIRSEAKSIWNNTLSKILVDGGTETQKTVFYTALYHTMVQPNTFSDADGNYRGMDKKIHKANGFTMYSVFSLWDTYRAWHPLMTIIDQARTLDYIKTFLNHYDQGGLLPVWELHGNETNCMIGYHSIPVIVDAFLKGISSFDTNKAYQAMIKSATRDNRGLKSLEQLGFIPADRDAESVSKTLEYAYDDWCIAQFAKAKGHKEDYITYIKRGQNYKNLFDPYSGNMRARINGGWFSPFDPTEVNYNYTEANSWQYSFSAPQDITGLISLHGGKVAFAGKLDELFNASPKTSGREQSDITGMIGQYAHGNEPSQHIAYLYPFAGQPWKTQRLVHTIMNDFYLDKPEGLIGNEDCGQMSAWAVMSAMGFYSVNPGSNFYVIGTPCFSKVTINLENGKKFVINARNINPRNYYIQSAELNSKKHNASFLKHDQIMKGGEITFEMGSSPNFSWGSGKKNEPETAITENLIVPAPFVTDAKMTFTDTKEVSISGPARATIHFTSSKGDGEYKVPIILNETGKIRFYAKRKGSVSKNVMSEFIRIKDDKDITLTYAPAGQYSGNGAGTLTDGMRGNEDYRVGGWLGFEKVNLEAIVDLRSIQSIIQLESGFLQDENSWIFMPSQVEYFISLDGKEFTSVGIVKNDIPVNKKGSIQKDFTLSAIQTEARYVKMIATNLGSCPAGHKGYPGPCWIFCDEISIE